MASVGLVDRKRGGRNKNGVAVGRRAAHGSCSEVAAGSTAIFNHHRMPNALAELLPNQAGDDVGDTAGREGDLERDGLRRIALRRRRPFAMSDYGRHEDAKSNAKSKESFHCRVDPTARHCACIIA